MSKESIDTRLVKEARELQEFFLNTYAEDAIESAISTGDNEVIRIVVNEFRDKRWQILEMQAQMEGKEA